MDGPEVLQFIQICRACMYKFSTSTSKRIEEHTGCIQYTSIYDYPSDKFAITIAQLIMDTTPQLVIQPDDELPQIICTSCLQKLISLYDFRQMCVSSDSELRRLISLNNKVNMISQDEEISSTPVTPTALITDASVEDPLHSIEIIKIDVTDEEQQSMEHDDCCQEEFNNSIENTAGSTNNEMRKCVETETATDVIHEEVPKTLCSTKDKLNAKYHSDSAADAEPISTSNSRGFQCDVCHRWFAKKKSLIGHWRCHKMPVVKPMPIIRQTSSKVQRENNDCVCKLCGKSFKKRVYLMRHNRTMHRPDLLKFVCEYCTKGFCSSKGLIEHIKTHTGERPYLCTECGHCLKSQSSLHEHMLRHTKQKKYECPDCPKKFVCLSDLSSHKVIHRKEKPHVCEICGNSFALPYILKAHKRNHSGEKPHKCAYCDMRFVRAEQKRRHERIHTGEKPYKCKYCDRAYTQSNELMKHLRVHLGENVYKCELCPRAFRLLCEQRKHFAEHKNDDDETRQRNLKALMEEQQNFAKQHNSTN